MHVVSFPNLLPPRHSLLSEKNNAKESCNKPGNVDAPWTAVQALPGNHPIQLCGVAIFMPTWCAKYALIFLLEIKVKRISGTYG